MIDKLIEITGAAWLSRISGKYSPQVALVIGAIGTCLAAVASGFPNYTNYFVTAGAILVGISGLMGHQKGAAQ